MTPQPLGVLAPTQLEGHDFVGKAVGQDFRLDRGAFHDRGADLERLTFTDEEHFVENQLAADRDGELFNPQFLSRGDSILLAPGSDDRVHADLRAAREKREIIHAFSECGQRNYAMLLTRR
jgi:hypothetical protein